MAYLSKYDQVNSKTPKKKYKQTRKKKVQTPRPTGEHVCAGCGKIKYLNIHHVYYNRGSRDLSSKYCCVDWLCWECHQSSTGIHGTYSDGKLDKELKEKHQLRLLNNGMTMDKFIELFGRSYIGMGG